MTAIALDRVSKSYGETRALHHLSLRVDRGEIFGLLGANGAGKTTTIRAISGVLRPDEGDVRICGVSVWDDPRPWKSVGIVHAENFATEPGFSPIRYLRYWAALSGIPRVRADDRILALMRSLRCEDQIEKPIGELSGGNRRKIELVRALILQPEVLILDEPTREIDLPSKVAYWNLIRRYAVDGERAVLLASHDPEEIAALCDRLAFLHAGRAVWTGSVSEVRGAESSLTQSLISKLQSAST